MTTPENLLARLVNDCRFSYMTRIMCGNWFFMETLYSFCWEVCMASHWGPRNSQ